MKDDRQEPFMGRKKEIDLLESLYESDKFEMLILRGAFLLTSQPKKN